jgi:glycerol kinase
MGYILSLDQGTSSSRALIFDKNARIISTAQKETTLRYPHHGWVEQDPMEIWETQISVAHEAMSNANISKKQITAIGITNQRETTIAWDRENGKPLHHAIIWQDLRTAPLCEEIIHSGLEPAITDTTGLIVHPYFSATKMKWLLENSGEVKDAAKRNSLCMGTVDAWLLYKLTAGSAFVTDHTNASRTMLYNIHTRTWDDELLKLFGIRKNFLPGVQDSGSHFGIAKGELEDIPICGIAGDQHAALLGQCCTKKGMVKNTYGTGCFLLMHSGSDPVKSGNRLLTTLTSDKNFYALEGSIFIGGAAVQWLRDGLGLISSSSEIESLASSVPDSSGVYFVPAFNGLGAPYWDTKASGIICGITGATTKAHIARATLESMAFQTADVVRAMSKDIGTAPGELRVDGGASVNDLLLQFQSDILDVPVVRPGISETTAFGAAILAGLQSGFWKDFSEIEQIWSIDKRFEPLISQSKRDQLMEGWHEAVARSRYRSTTS